LAELAADLAALRPFWHPVAYAAELGEEPLGVTVLGEPVVVHRDGDDVRAFRDLCPHRGSKLSLGRVIEGRLTCPYHGFRYDGSGRCVLIPSQPPDHQVIPSRLRLQAYAAQECHGIVWVALEEPRLPVPACPLLYETGFHSFSPASITWRTSAARWMENFLDMTHFAHVHPGILADPEEPVVAPYEVHLTPTGLTYEFALRQQLDPARWPTSTGGVLEMEDAYAFYELFLPFTISIVTDTPGEGRWAIWTAGLPVGPAEVRLFFVVSRDYLLEEADEPFADAVFAIADQDRPIAENQHPEMLPVDLTEEVHLRVGDAVGLAYRRQLREIGLTYA
jgi:phenylpropionate dioxygenase-like ring-hydroxylating dioxygenase large terminal subunit